MGFTSSAHILTKDKSVINLMRPKGPQIISSIISVMLKTQPQMMVHVHGKLITVESPACQQYSLHITCI